MPRRCQRNLLLQFRSSLAGEDSELVYFISTKKVKADFPIPGPFKLFSQKSTNNV